MFLNGKISVEVENANGLSVINTIKSIEITNDCTQLGATCEIEVPLNCRIENKGQFLLDNVRTQFKKGDKIKITAWYSEYENISKPIIFEGFIWDFTEGNPVKIKCIDYVYKLIGGIATNSEGGKNGLYYSNKKEYRFKDIVKDILKGTEIDILEPFLDFNVTGLSLPNMSPKACLEHFKKELGLTMTLIGQKLYCNLAKFTFNTIKLDSSINVVKCDLQKPDDVYQKTKVNFYTENEKGVKQKVTVGDEDGDLSEIFLYVIKNKQTQQKLVDNYLENRKLSHYKGKITTLLYPVIDLFDKIEYNDIRYKDRSGNYTVRGYTLTLDTNGFRRVLTLAYLG